MYEANLTSATGARAFLGQSRACTAALGSLAGACMADCVNRGGVRPPAQLRSSISRRLRLRVAWSVPVDAKRFHCEIRTLAARCGGLGTHGSGSFYKFTDVITPLRRPEVFASLRSHFAYRSYGPQPTALMPRSISRKERGAFRGNVSCPFFPESGALSPGYAWP